MHKKTDVTYLSQARMSARRMKLARLSKLYSGGLAYLTKLTKVTTGKYPRKKDVIRIFARNEDWDNVLFGYSVAYLDIDFISYKPRERSGLYSPHHNEGTMVLQVIISANFLKKIQLIRLDYPRISVITAARRATAALTALADVVIKAQVTTCSSDVP